MTEKFTSRLTGVFSVSSLLLGLVFFSASLTPSLIPRGPEMQGVLGGLVTALGYLCAQILALLWWALDLPRLPARIARWLTWASASAVAALFLWVLGSSLEWQNDLRGKMDLPAGRCFASCRDPRTRSANFCRYLRHRPASDFVLPSDPGMVLSRHAAAPRECPWLRRGRADPFWS